MQSKDVPATDINRVLLVVVMVLGGREEEGWVAGVGGSGVGMEVVY